MINNIYKILNSKERIFFKYIFFLMVINSALELISLAVFYPLVKFLTDNTYGMDAINAYLAEFNYEITNSNGLLFFFLGAILIVFFIKNSFYIFYIYEINKFIKKVRLRVSNELIEKYIRMPYNIFFKKSLANILRNIELSINFSTIVLSLLTFYSEILIFILLIGFLLNIELKFTLAIIIITSLLILIFKRFSKDRFYELGILSQKYSQSLKKEILQTFSGIREVKILKKELYFNKKFNKINNLEATNNLVRDVLLQLPKVVIETLVVLLLITIIFLMLFLGFDKTETLIYVSLMIVASSRLMPSAIRIIATVQRLKFTQPHCKILIEEFKKSSYLVQSNNKQFSKVLSFKNKIIFRNVNFYYEKNKYVLRNFNLEIAKNSCVGIVGPSGSGKSTFTDLLIGLLKPSSGIIKIDNSPLNHCIDSWQDKISYVSQSPFFLNDTIEKNIAFGLQGNKINKKLLIEVSKKAQIYEYINSTNQKFKTKVGEGGINFSGGQLQRIAIARALYKKSELLILDESTNSLDPESEFQFFKFLKNIAKEITIIIISHDNKNLVMCDKIYIIDKKMIFKDRRITSKQLN
jgi:ABC-type bacteriocin/lantibiotic exporter with double-glycine peptidase domain